MGEQQTKQIYLDLPGESPNGAMIWIHPDSTATIHIIGIESADDLVKIFETARDAGGIRGTVYTGSIVHDGILVRCTRKANKGQTDLGGRVTRLGPDWFMIEYDEFPEFH
jgi:hypothetical protein